MKGVPVAPDVGARAAGYSPRRQYFSKAPGFMLPITGASTTVRQRKVKRTKLRLGEKRKVKPIRFRVGEKRKVKPTKLRVGEKRKVKPTRLRVGEKRKVKPTRFRVTRNRKTNILLEWAPEDESCIG
jgi:hypothetical protein